MSQNSAQPEKVWIVHSFKEKPKISIFLLLFLFLLCLGINFTFGSLLFSIIAAALLFGSLSSFFLPVRYELYPDQIVVRTPFHKTRRDWRYFRKFYTDKNGVFLSPFESPSRLENYRGVYVRFGKDRDEVLKLIREKVGDERMRG